MNEAVGRRARRVRRPLGRVNGLTGSPNRPRANPLRPSERGSEAERNECDEGAVLRTSDCGDEPRGELQPNIGLGPVAVRPKRILLAGCDLRAQRVKREPQAYARRASGASDYDAES